MKKNTEFIPNTTSSRIIENGNIEVLVKDIESRVKNLPDLYSDALFLRYGLGEYDPITESEIAEIFADENRIPMTGDLVSGIIRDALFMIKSLPEESEPVNISDELPAGIPGDLQGRELTWNMIARILRSYKNDDELDEYLYDTFGDSDYVIVPRIDSIYFTYSPTLYDIDGYDTVLTNSDVMDYRGLAEFIIEKLDKKGLCIVSDIEHKKTIDPADIYAYAYLETSLAMKITKDNPLKLIAKIKQMR